jgi:hypothetical protein
VVFQFQVSGETFKAHRCVLAARSPVFNAQFFGQMKESDAAAGVVVCIDDMEAHVFEALLFFVYTDSLPEMNSEEEAAMFQHLLVAADRYDLERLKLICEHKPQSQNSRNYWVMERGSWNVEHSLKKGFSTVETKLIHVPGTGTHVLGIPRSR